MEPRIPSAVVEALKVYVYRLIDPRTDETFYVGMGQGERVLQHAWAALADTLPADRLERIRQIRASGAVERIIIHRHGMDRPTALDVEAALIDAYRDLGLTNLVTGHGAEFGATPLEDLVDRYGAPEANISMPAILIKIEQEWSPKLSAEQLYERTRRYWYSNPEARVPSPTHAIAVARGLIREVYAIDRWEEYCNWPTDLDLSRIVPYEQWTPNQVRRGFVGHVANEYAHLKRTSVRHLMRTGSQNPIAYVNC